MTPEGEVVREIRRAVREAGGIVRKCSWEAVRGAPDLFVMLYGRHAWIEAKAPAGRLAGHQIREIERMIKAGCSVFVIRNKTQAREWVEKFKRGEV